MASITEADNSPAAAVEYLVTAISNDEQNTWDLTVSNKATSEVVESLSLNRVYGIPCSRVCNSTRWKELNDRVHYHDTDIIIASYPKCGTTWSEQCVLLITNGANPDVLDPQSKNSYDSETKVGKVWIETMVNQVSSVEETMGKEGRCISWEEFDNIPGPRVLKTHAPLPLLLGISPSLPAGTMSPPPIDQSIQALQTLPLGCKILVVVRNPLDACVSCYYHPKNSPAKRGWPFDAFAEVYFQGYVSFGSYFDWIRDWYTASQIYPDRIVWIEYEDMKKHPMETTHHLAEFLLQDAHSKIDASFIEKVVTYSSFEEMKRQIDQKSGGDKLEHMRGGRIGDWRSHFSPEMVEKFVQKTRLTLPSELAERLLGYAGIA